ncbi:hypothetical protein CCACVL1_00544, partial [Corchorus capsularis]
AKHQHIVDPASNTAVTIHQSQNPSTKISQQKQWRIKTASNKPTMNKRTELKSNEPKHTTITITPLKVQ